MHLLWRITPKWFLKQKRKDNINKKSLLNWQNSNNKSTEHNGQKHNTCLRCGLEDHFITNFPKLDTSENKVHRNTDNNTNRAYISTKIDRMSENSTYQSESQKTYMSMERMSYNEEISRRDFGDSLQLNNCILDSGATCQMTLDILDFILR